MNAGRLIALALLTLPALAQEKPAEKPLAEEQPKAEAEPKPESQPKIELSGYAQLDYRRADPGSLDGAPAHEVNARRVRLTIAARITDRVSSTVTIQGDGVNVNTASVIDASASVRLASFLRAQLGQYKYDFDVSGRESDSQLTLADRSLPTNAIAGGLNGVSTPSSPSSAHRDRGLSLAGEHGRIAYSAGVFQGSGRASDNNSSFAFVSRLQYLPRKNIRLSGGWLASNTANEGAPTKGHYRAWTLGAAYEGERTLLRAEYYAGRRERGPVTEKPEGFYVEGAVGVVRNTEVLLRYEEIDDPAVSTLGKAQIVGFGARYYLARKGRGGTSLLANVMLRDAPNGDVKGLTLLNDGRGATLTDGHDFGAVFVLRLQVQF